MNLFRSRPPQESTVATSKRMRELEVVTARLMRAGFAGQYHSAFHGRGIEFAQVREYQPGDDIRTIDWNVTARTGVPHVKEFVEERDLTVVVAIDISRSMQFGSIDRRKIDLAVELTAVLSFSALQNGDRVGLALFNERVVRFVPPARGRRHVQTLVRTALVEGRRTSGTADFARFSDFCGRTLTKRSVIIALSDYLEAGFAQPFRRLNVRHDVIAIEINDPRESYFPKGGLITLLDSESGKRSTVDLDVTRVAANAMVRRRQVIDRFIHAGVDRVEISTGVPYEKTLLGFFERRTARPR